MNAAQRKAAFDLPIGFQKEVMLFQHVTKAIKAEGVNLPQSHKYQPLDGYLISAERWRRDRDQLLEQPGSRTRKPCFRC